MKNMYGIILIAFFAVSTYAAEDLKMPTAEQATELVKKSLQNLIVDSSKNYCTKGTMTCRTMYLLKDKDTGIPANVYYDTFYSADRQVGSTCYFIPLQNDPKSYYVFTDSVFDGKIAIDMVSPLIAHISASSDLNNILFDNLRSPKIGTTQYSLAKFIQSEGMVILDGTLYDQADPHFSQPIHIEYVRIYP